MIMSKPNYRQIYAIEKKNKERLLKVNPNLDNESGIYFLTRVEPQGYIGQARHLIQRLCSHMTGYEQHIDLSLKVHGLYDEKKNPYGYKINFLHFPENELDEKEQFYIQQYLDNGYTLKNKTAGSQGKGKVKIADFKPSKTYRDGLKQGEKNLARELSNIIDKHLVVTLKPEKANNKVSQKQFKKFKELLKVGDKNE
jgi:hypothetical protein